MRRAHPRLCGEHANGLKDAVKGVGSSPPVRGARGDRDVAGNRLGLIPACAGSTLILDGTPSIRRAHPRLCGEHRAMIEA